jgi:hypothetical protein
METYLKAANQVEKADVVVEADGFMWNVIGIAYNNKRVSLTISPVYPSMTARGERTVNLKKSASVRVAA